MEPRSHSPALPQLSGQPVVTDGGLETDLIYHHDVDLPDFAAFPLVDDERGRELLLRYYRDYVDIAKRAGVALQLETPTWRASGDWGDRLGYTAPELRRVNRDAVALLDRLRDEAGLESLLISGSLGPRGDGYVAGEVVDPDVAAAYHAPQIEAFADAGADLITVLTLTGTTTETGARASAGFERTRRPAATRSSTPPRSSTRATPWSSPGRRTRCGRTCRTSRWSAGVAVPTPDTWPRCGTIPAERARR